ncbi:diphosphomevalonate decarboxylase [Tissierella creatinophila]|uniref:diphosphomevalonate decarboxylase n=1 Tax=Tissierella creatinophila DSM 6911 TaxID=1123403 RepID=A0A1U7M8K8_TISCR|nr:diphosphomevalonate decarboxylase [Tissierella creatinophila]OLS03616.1 homoserine kinase [Tissierella creatinophila DSM 6911]
MKAKARAHANIALIKYWGKSDENLSLPMNSSLSLTLDAFYTETEVEFTNSINEDVFFLNGVEDKNTLSKISKFLDLFRIARNMNERAIIKTINYVPTAAGLASSASGFAALAAATNKASGLDVNSRELSTFARRGSGSATRSIYGGIVEWQKGINDKTSFAVEIDDASWDIGMVVVIVNREEKKMSSREGMKSTILTSPFYKNWPEDSQKDLKEIKIAIKEKDFEKMGYITERNALKMHATMLGANPPIMYFEPKSILVMQIVHELRDKGIPCFFTMDAGPNVKILCRLSQGEMIKNRLMEDFKEYEIIVTGPGPGVEII